jgi:two-component system sensor histidine kinase TctE
MIVPQTIILVTVSVLIWYGVGRGIAPLRGIQEAIMQRTHNELSPLDETGLPVEVREQVHVINDLIERLSRVITSQRRFIADATHQLRTPMTVLKAQVELALRAESFNELRPTVEKISGTAARLARLANQLLSLSRAEAGPDRNVERQPMNVGDIAEEVVSEFVPAAVEKDIEIDVDIPSEALTARGDRHLFAEMLGNLVDNAIRYTPREGHVAISLRSHHARAFLTISDNGPGIGESERDRVFERFYRATSGSSEGSGLGLSIAREIAHLHEGDIRLENATREGGLKVVVEIPLSSDRPQS